LFNIDSGVPCARHPESMKWLGGAYGTFTILFLEFFYVTYIAKKKTKTA